jgi:hypothetical protein
MTFYEQVRSFFKKYDPARIRLAKKIANVYRSPTAQKAVMRRLKEVYAAGGPENFNFGEYRQVAAKPVIKEANQKIEEKASEVVDEINDVDDSDGLEEVAD